MKRFKVICMILLTMMMSVACSKVPAGNVGVKVHLLGGSKGVDSEEIGPGRYWIGPNEELYLFPTYTQNYVWTKNPTEGSLNDESITFQTTEGMSITTDIGIAYHIESTMVNSVFQKYRRGVEEITDIALRNIVRDAMNTVGSAMEVTYVYGAGKAAFMTGVTELVNAQVAPIGIIVEKISIVGRMILPPTVVKSLNRKIEATQRAEQRENELREAQAQAKKVVAEADGKAKSILAVAVAQAQANIKIAKSLTKELVAYERIKKWDGVMPKMVGAGTPLVNMEL